MQAGCEENNLRRKDGELTICSVLGVTATRESDDANDISSAQLLMLSLERNIALGMLSLAHNLNLDSLGTDIVEDQLRTRRPLGVDSASDADFDVRLLFALLETFVVLQELPEVGRHMELVRIRVRLLGLAKFVDSLAPDFEVLLRQSERFTR